MRRSFRTGLVLAAVGALLAGCDSAPEPDALFPLAAGLEWQYRVTTRPHGEDPRDSRLTMSNVERGYFAGEEDILIRRNQHGTRYYIAEREDGLYRVAVKSVAQTVPIMDQPRHNFDACARHDPYRTALVELDCSPRASILREAAPEHRRVGPRGKTAGATAGDKGSHS